jgi:SAM-dependent methyltransferase
VKTRLWKLGVALARRIPLHRRYGGPLVDAGMLAMPIELPGGGVVQDLTSAKHWLDVARGASDGDGDARHAIFVEELLAEAHHHSYGKEWIGGRVWLDFLVAQGLRSSDRVLDIGCGAGRVGVRAVDYLEPDRYFGVDAHLRSLVAFSAYEIRLNGLAPKHPRLLLDSEFRFTHFGERFEVALDINVTNHLPLERFRRSFTNLRSVLAPGGRVFVRAAVSRPATEEARKVRADERLDLLRALGYELAASFDEEWPFPDTGSVPRDKWWILRMSP